MRFLKKYFNGETIAGRANGAKATYISLAAFYIYHRYRQYQDAAKLKLGASDKDQQRLQTEEPNELYFNQGRRELDIITQSEQNDESDNKAVTDEDVAGSCKLGQQVDQPAKSNDLSAANELFRSTLIEQNDEFDDEAITAADKEPSKLNSSAYSQKHNDCNKKLQKKWSKKAR